MKNSRRISEYLDYHAETIRLMRAGTIEGAQEACERVQSDRCGDLGRACLDDGWTTAELDEAFYRRFNYRAPR